MAIIRTWWRHISGISSLHLPADRPMTSVLTGEVSGIPITPVSTCWRFRSKCCLTLRIIILCIWIGLYLRQAALFRRIMWLILLPAYNWETPLLLLVSLAEESSGRMSRRHMVSRSAVLTPNRCLLSFSYGLMPIQTRQSKSPVSVLIISRLEMLR